MLLLTSFLLSKRAKFCPHEAQMDDSNKNGNLDTMQFFFSLFCFCSFICSDVRWRLKRFLSCILHPDRIFTSPCGLPVTSCSALPPVGLSRAPGVHQKTFHSGASPTVALCAASQPPLSRRGRVLSHTITFHSSQRQSHLFTLAALSSPFPSPTLRLVLMPLIDSVIRL